MGNTQEANAPMARSKRPGASVDIDATAGVQKLAVVDGFDEDETWVGLEARTHVYTHNYFDSKTMALGEEEAKEVNDK